MYFKYHQYIKLRRLSYHCDNSGTWRRNTDCNSEMKGYSSEENQEFKWKDATVQLVMFLCMELQDFSIIMCCDVQKHLQKTTVYNKTTEVFTCTLCHCIHLNMSNGKYYCTTQCATANPVSKTAYTRVSNSSPEGPEPCVS